MQEKPVEKSIKFNDLTIWAESFGENSNPVCILIAGAGAHARFWSDDFCVSLAHRGYFVIRFDHRDTGLSSEVDFSKNPYSIDDLAKDVLNILDAYQIKQAHVIGHSMGGYIVQQLAIKYSSRIQSITIISVGPISATEETDQPISSDEKSLYKKTWEVMLANKPTQDFEESLDGFLKVWRYLNGSVEFDKDKVSLYTHDMYKHIVVMGDVLKVWTSEEGTLKA